MNDLAKFRRVVLEEDALQNELAALDEDGAFISCAVAATARLGLSITPDALEQALRRDPLGLARWSSELPGTAAPQQGWLPTHVIPVQGEYCVDWAYFGAFELHQPFFENSVRLALHRPLNRLVRHRTRLSDLPAHAVRYEHIEPSGFIFHMSRCGSTLVAQMLASDPRNIVVSEASPLDAVLQIASAIPDGRADGLVEAMVFALGQKRTGQHGRFFVKLDSWHTLHLPMLRRVFPSAPWIFLYREPIEVLASQSLERGIQTLPGFLPPAQFGLEAHLDDAPDAYGARILRRLCSAVVENYENAGGLLVNYSQLPAAVWQDILPHFGIPASDADRARMLQTAQFDAKAPGLPFTGRDDLKAQRMTKELLALADLHLADVYRRLEDLRGQA